MPTEDEILSVVKEMKGDLHDLMNKVNGLESTIKEIRGFTKKTKDDMYYVKQKTSRIE